VPSRTSIGRKKRPRDMNQLPYQIVQEATGQARQSVGGHHEPSGVAVCLMSATPLSIQYRGNHIGHKPCTTM
jgi:hypothetical protein